MTSDFHLTIYDKTLYHLSEYDFLEEFLTRTASFYVFLFEHGMRLMNETFSFLTIEQIDNVKQILGEAITRIE